MNDPMLAQVPDSPTVVLRRRYDRIAPIYDALESLMELRGRRWRRDLLAGVTAGQVLEVGAGTGKNLPFYPPGAEVTATDISKKMLARACHRARWLDSSVKLEIADVQRLPYPDRTFDVAVATFVFCSVPDPVLGLRELRRVLKPGGRLLLLEHVLSARPWLRWCMRRLDTVPFAIWGAHIDRDTVDNVRVAGFEEIRATGLFLDVVQRIETSAGRVEA